MIMFRSRYLLSRVCARASAWLMLALLPITCVAADFVHPGILHTQQDFDRMKAAIAAQTNPIYQGYVAFAADSGSQLSYTMQGPFAGAGRDSGEHTTEMHNDANAVYQQAVMWAVT